MVGKKGYKSRVVRNSPNRKPTKGLKTDILSVFTRLVISGRRFQSRALGSRAQGNGSLKGACSKQATDTLDLFFYRFVHRLERTVHIPGGEVFRIYAPLTGSLCRIGRDGGKVDVFLFSIGFSCHTLLFTMR